MKEIKNIKRIDKIPQELEYELQLTDGHCSQVKIIREFGEFVVVGDSAQHFCESELVALADKLANLNEKYGTEDSYDNDKDNEPDFDDDEDSD